MYLWKKLFFCYDMGCVRIDMERFGAFGTQPGWGLLIVHRYSRAFVGCGHAKFICIYIGGHGWSAIEPHFGTTNLTSCARSKTAIHSEPERVIILSC